MFIVILRSKWILQIVSILCNIVYWKPMMLIFILYFFTCLVKYIRFFIRGLFLYLILKWRVGIKIISRKVYCHIFLNRGEIVFVHIFINLSHILCEIHISFIFYLICKILRFLILYYVWLAWSSLVFLSHNNMIIILLHKCIRLLSSIC